MINPPHHHEATMHFVIDMLMSGNKNIVTYFGVAKQRWEGLIQAHSSVEDLARRLSSEQMWFETNCGGRWEGQEVMVISGITQFYSLEEGFGDRRNKALDIYNAFMKSQCSLEVKGEADKIAKSYFLFEEE